MTAHDGFTLRDLVSYNEKHNEANGEGQQRTARATTGPGTAAWRARPTTRGARAAGRQHRNFLATLLLSQGVPMLLTATSSAAPSAATTTSTARTTSSSWMDWELDADPARPARVHPAGRGAAQEHPVFRRRRFFAGEATGTTATVGRHRVVPARRHEHGDADWAHEHARSMMVFLNGDGWKRIVQSWRR